MMKKWLISIAAAAVVCLSLTGCYPQRKNSVEQDGKTIYPVSSYDETLEIYLGDVMPFYDDGVMNIYHLQNSKGSLSMFYHPIARLTTTDFVNYKDCGIAVNYEEDVASVDAAIGTGSFIKGEDGNFHCFYTGHNDNGHDEGLPFNEVIRHAISRDNQETWEKVEDFKLYGKENDFRDPYVYYDGVDGCYYMLVTTRVDGRGVIKRYAASTLYATDEEWRDAGVFFYNDGGDYNMECPSYVEYNGVYYLAYSEQGANRVTHYRYRTSHDGEWQKFANDSIDDTGFYAGRLEKTDDGLYAFAWCANLSGGSSGEFDWGGNLVVHKLSQRSNGELCAVMVPSVKESINTEIFYRFKDGSDLTDLSFSGEKFGAYGLERLGKNVTRMRFKFTVGDFGGDFGLTFGLDGAYDNRLGQNLLAFDFKNSALTAYNGVSSVVRYGSPLASVSFAYTEGKEYVVDIIKDGEILTAYLDETVCLTARFPDISKRNFAFYSNGAKVEIKEMSFYE